MRSDVPKYFFSKKEKQLILSAIQTAENKTSGEIRVHVQRETSQDILAEAKQVFEKLGMTRTQERNGVLILFGIKNRHFAILGDKEIHEKVPGNFWEDVRLLMQKDFLDDRFADGLTEGIHRVGEKLQAYFPAQKDNPNELSDRISYGRI